MTHPVNKVLAEYDSYHNAPIRSSIKAETKAWLRFSARFIDVILFSMALIFSLEISTPSYLRIPLSINNTLEILFLWIFVESIFLNTIGSTPGKWLLNISLTTMERKKLSLSEALKRSFSVWFYGLAFGLPILSIFTLFFSYITFTRKNKTSWDQSGHFQVTHGKINYYKSLVAIAILILGIFLISIDIQRILFPSL